MPELQGGAAAHPSEQFQFVGRVVVVGGPASRVVVVTVGNVVVVVGFATGTMHEA